LRVQLIDVSLRVGSETWLYPFSLTLAQHDINVLLGTTRAGKTTLLRVLAGLDRPTTGRLLSGAHDLTGVHVRKRNVAMVYQQFINYPSLTVYENIASPLRIAGVGDSETRAQVGALADTLHLSALLDRHPAELSGGQQQRVALARALAKQAELILLDEPLVNLDYKLREELRSELANIFKQRRTTIVYATTDPQEALQLGGHTVLLSEGRVLQSGPTLDVFRRPSTLEAARAFSNPPLNVITARLGTDRTKATLENGATFELPASLRARLHASPADVTCALRPHQFSLTPCDAARTRIEGTVEIAEISGSDTYVHVSSARQSLVAQLPGVHDFALGAPCELFFDPAELYCFDEHGALLVAPER
jgi:glycerol transport system ATP-binding protein